MTEPRPDRRAVLGAKNLGEERVVSTTRAPACLRAST